MKKLLTLLLSLFALACVPLTLTACDLGGTHTHTFGEWVAEVPATCTTNGTKAHKDCTECNKHFDSDGKEIADLTIPTSHTFGSWVAKVPETCTTDGVKGHKDCTVCNKHFDVFGTEITDLTIPAGHSYGEWVTNGNGTHTKTCANDSTHTVTENCHGGTATATQKAICSDCGAEYGDFAEQQPSSPSEETPSGQQPSSAYSQGLEFKATDYSGYWVKGIGTCTDTEIVIPAEYGGEKVIGISYDAFKDCTSITSVVLSSGIKTISSYAFDGCTGLTSITIPDTVETIYSSSFSGCTNLTEIIISENNKDYSVDNGVIYNKEKTQLCAYLPSNTAESFTVPDGVTDIEGHAFSYCNLTSIVISKDVTKIDYGNLALSCESLASITVANGNTVYGSADGILYNNDKTTMLYVPEAISGKITIPDSVTSIGSSLLSLHKSLTSVVIGNGVTDIKGAFINCTGLESVTIGSGVTDINQNTFKGCTSLTSVTISENNQTYCVENGVIYNKDKTKLVLYLQFNTAESFTVPDSVTTIWGYAFQNCTSLTSIIIPASVTKMGYQSFDGCSNLKTAYYKGDKTQWYKIKEDNHYTDYLSATVYYYSENEPTGEGNYWHYDNNSVPTVWESKGN